MTPRQLGFRMPAEWEPHQGTWLTWPHNPETWPGKMGPIPGIWADMISALCPHEEVHINVNDAAMAKTAQGVLNPGDIERKNIFFHHFPSNDCWVRDHGPVFVTREKKGKREVAITDWIFNMWGGKYPPWDLDNAIPQRIANKFKYSSFQPGIVLEGGSIDVNGKGTLLTTEQCLLNKNRNPNLTKEQIEQYLRDYLGVDHILWLWEGIKGDDTDGHIDDIARFAGPNIIITVVEEDKTDENFYILQENLKRLKKMRDQDGRPFDIVEIPMPRPVNYEGQRLPASYANFYIANQVVLVPTYRHPNDQRAIDTLTKLFPDRKIVDIDATDLVWGFGAFHCITQQQPAV